MRSLEPTPAPSLKGREFIYDLSGRLVQRSKEEGSLESLPKGVYINNGRKVIIK